MTVTNVKSEWIGGNLVFKDKADAIILTFDGTNRKLTFPSGAVLDLSAATGSVSLAAGEIGAADLAVGAVTTDKILDANVTAAKWAQGAGVAAVIAAGLGASAAYVKADTGVKTLVSADAAKARSTIIVAVVTETFAGTGENAQTTFKIGEADADDKYAATAVFTDAALGAVKVLAGGNTINKAIIVTVTPKAGNGTGAISVVALVLPAA